jgi:hypothetical protein
VTLLPTGDFWIHSSTLAVTTRDVAAIATGSRSVPEPSSIFLLGTALLGLAALRRRTDQPR